MFGFVDKIIRRLFPRTAGSQRPVSAPHQPPPATAPGTQLHYEPHLIAKLTEDHRALVELYRQIASAHKDGEHHQIKDLLEEFDRLLRQHLLIENTRLYVYLQHTLERGTDKWTTMHDFQHEMKAIGKTVTGFLDRYSTDQWDEALKESFGPELDKVGAVLSRRIQSEEKVLYPQYQSLAPTA